MLLKRLDGAYSNKFSGRSGLNMIIINYNNFISVRFNFDEKRRNKQ